MLWPEQRIKPHVGGRVRVAAERQKGWQPTSARCAIVQGIWETGVVCGCGSTI